MKCTPSIIFRFDKINSMKSISVHQISDAQNIPFSRRKYSRLKCGAEYVAREYAKGIFEKFIAEVRLDADAPVIVFSSAYQHIPNAASIITKWFFYYLNNHLATEGLRPATLSKIIRNPTYFTDYGSLSKEERELKISKDRFYIDREFCAGKTLIFIDDIKVTGTHERKIQKALLDAQVEARDVYYLYWAEVINEDIDAAIEAALNYAEISDLKGLLQLYENHQVEFIVRTIRYILQAPKEEFLEFINNRTRQDKEKIYFLGLSENYHNVPKFRRNLQRLKKIIHL